MDLRLSFMEKLRNRNQVKGVKFLGRGAPDEINREG